MPSRSNRAFASVDASTPAVVLSAKSHGSLGIIRTLGRLGVDAYAVDGQPRGAAGRSKYLRKRFVHDLSSAPEATVDFLIALGRRIGGRPVLIPTWDETSILVSEFQEALAEWWLFPRQPAGLALRLSDKRTMADLARAHGIPTPGIVVPGSTADVEAFSATAAFPVMLKAIDGNRLYRRTGVKMAIVESRSELRRRYTELEDPEAPNLMLQEYIPGGDDTVWMFNGYFNADGTLLYGATGQKIRQSPVYTGATSLGVCLDNPEVRTTTERWMRELGYRGILDIGYRYDARDGQYKVLDVNPRVGATFRLFASRDGMDVVRALYLDLTGQAVSETEAHEGRKWMVEKDFASSLRYRRDGKLTIRAWLRSLRGVRELGYWSLDDPRPFLHLVGSLIRPAGQGAGSGRM